MLGRKHGDPPYGNVVVHGGPGAPGSAYGLAKGIEDLGAIEPFQSGRTVASQVAELAGAIRAEAELPVHLVGHSWGAMLAAMTAAAHPDLVCKLVMVGSGGFTAESYVRTNETRMKRLSPQDRARAEQIQAHRRANPDKPEPELTLEYYNLISAADAFDLDPEDADPPVQFQNDVNKQVWADAVRLRESGELARFVSQVRCPIVAIHGVHDPHPADAVAQPFPSRPDFRMVALEKCGHEPWKERQARKLFFELLRAELV